MSNENKTALTAEEILWKYMAGENVYISDKHRETILTAMQEFASLQTQEKDKEIAELKKKNKEIKIQRDKAYGVIQPLKGKVKELKSTIESQQKEIEDLKAYNTRLIEAEAQCDYELTQAKKQIESKSNRIKDLDECNRVTINRLLIMEEWLNPVPHTDVEACLSSINHAIQAINELLPKQETSNTQTPNTQPENNFTTCHNCTSDLLCKAQKQCNLINH